MFDVWGRLAETGSGNKSPLVVFESVRQEQRGGMLTFGKIMKFVVYYAANFPTDIGRVRREGVAPRKPEVEISRRWWRLTVLRWNNLETC